MSRLQRLFEEQGQSPWLDNLSRPLLHQGTLGRLVHDGIRGVTANPAIFARAIQGSDAYDEQLTALTGRGCPVPDAYWRLAEDDVTEAALPEATIAAFEDHGTLARSIDTDTAAAAEVIDRLAGLGIDLAMVGRSLEDQGVASFHQSFTRTLQALQAKAGRPTSRASAGARAVGMVRS
jgi:transaldolase